MIVTMIIVLLGMSTVLMHVDARARQPKLSNKRGIGPAYVNIPYCNGRMLEARVIGPSNSGRRIWVRVINNIYHVKKVRLALPGDVKYHTPRRQKNRRQKLAKIV